MRDRKGGTSGGAIVTGDRAAKTSPVLTGVAGKTSIVSVGVVVPGNALAEIRVAGAGGGCVLVCVAVGAFPCSFVGLVFPYRTERT